MWVDQPCVWCALLRLPQLAHHHGQESQCATGALKVGDGSDLQIEYPDQFRMKRIGDRKLVQVIGALGALVNSRTLRIQFLVIGAVALDCRLGCLPVYTFEESMDDDGRDFVFTCRRQDPFLPRRNLQRLTKRLGLGRERIILARHRQDDDNFGLTGGKFHQ